MKTGGWLLILFVSICAVVRGDLRLWAESDGRRWPMGGVEDGKIWLDDGGVRRVVPTSVTWKLEGDFEREADAVLWRVPGALRRPTGVNEVDAKHWTATVLFPRKPFGTKLSDAFVDWPDAKAPGAVAVAAWLVDGVATRVGVAVLPAGSWDERFRVGVAVDVPREELPGVPVALLWTEGVFAKPERLFADTNQMRAEKAARRGDLVELKKMADDGVKLAFANEKGWTLLHVAAAAGRTQVAEFLVEREPAFFLSDYTRWMHSPLEEAVGWYRVETTRRLLVRGVGLQQRAFGEACEQGKAELAKWLSASQTKTALFGGSYRYTIVSRATANGYEDIAALLAQWSFIGNMSLAEKDDLLLKAVRLGYGKLARELLTGRAAARLRVNGEPLLQLAARHCATEAMSALMDKGAKWTDTDSAGRDALQTALLASSRESVLLLFKRGARLDVTAKDAGAYVEAAVAIDAAPLVSDAVARGWKPDTAFPDGLNAYHVGKIYRAKECLAVLEEAGASADVAPAFPVLASVEKLDAPPKPTTPLRLTDPYEAYESFPEAKIFVRVFVDPQGRVRLPVVTGDLNPRLHASVVATVKSWMFAPMTVQEKPVGVVMNLPFVMPETVAVVPVPFRWPLKDADTEVIADLKSVSQQPRLLKQTHPRVPLTATKKAVTVKLRFVVDRNGEVEPEMEVVSAPNAAFDEAAMKAVLTWTFEPGFASGQPVRTRMQVPIIFAPGEKPAKGAR